MLQHQTTLHDSNIVPVSRISMCSGKSAMPYVKGGFVAYPNRYRTGGMVDKVTTVEADPYSEDGFIIRVTERGANRENLETVYYAETSAQGVIEHVFQDLQTENHRLYSAESVAKRERDPQRETPGNPGNSGYVAFSDGVSAVLSALEWMTGESCSSRFSPVSRTVGCKSNFPTLEKVVHGQASRHVRVRRPAGSKSFSSGMPTTQAGGAKPPTMSEQISRNSQASRRNLEQAEEAYEAGNQEEAEYRFNVACEYETKASKGREVLNSRMSLIRERAAVMRAAKKAKKEASAA